MAISPLALGIGLQGKYDYKRQTMLDLARERGRAKAEAAEAEARAKKRAPYERALMKVDTSGLLPYQAKLIKEKYADALQSFEDAPDDYSLHAANMQDINSSSKAFRDQAENYKRLSLTRDRMPADEEALTIIGTLSDPKAIQEALGKLGPASSVQFANDQFLFSNPKYQGIGDSITKFVKSSMFDPEQGVNEFTIGDRKYGGADINTQVPGIITENIMRTDNLRQSAINDYLQYAQTNNIPYDFSTKESTNEFLNNTTKYVNDNAKKYIDSLSKQYGGSKTQFTNIYNAPGVEKALTINPASGGDIILKYANYSDFPFEATPLGKTATGNYNALLANTTRTFDMNTGEQIDRAQVKDTDFNEMGVFYVLNKDFEDLKAGLIVPNAYINKAIEFGVVEPQILALGLQKGDTGKSVYFPVSNVALSQIMDTNPKDRKSIETLQNSLEQKRKEVAASLGQKGVTPASKGTTPTAKKEVTKPTATPPAQAKAKPANTNAAQKSGEKPKKQPPKGTEDIFGELEKAAKPKNK
jgi:hypothetical protein